MSFTKPIAVFLFLCSISIAAMAQNDPMAPDSAVPAKKPLCLTFGLDVKMKSLGGSYLHDYTGEYNSYIPGQSGWQWVNHKTVYTKLLASSNFTDVKLSVLIGKDKNFQYGLSYNFGFISGKIPEINYDTIGNPGTKVNSVQHDISYAGIGVIAGYNYFFNKETELGLFAYGTADLGFYTGTDDIFGPGVPWFIQGKLGLGYNINRDVMFKVYVATDQLIYHENSTSQVFNRTQTLNIDVRTYYLGLGISKTFTILPD